MVQLQCIDHMLSILLVKCNCVVLHHSNNNSVYMNSFSFYLEFSSLTLGYVSQVLMTFAYMAYADT